MVEPLVVWEALRGLGGMRAIAGGLGVGMVKQLRDTTRGLLKGKSLKDDTHGPGEMQLFTESHSRFDRLCCWESGGPACRPR